MSGIDVDRHVCFASLVRSCGRGILQKPLREMLAYDSDTWYASPITNKTKQNAEVCSSVCVR
jgi:hypothetical protein